MKNQIFAGLIFLIYFLCLQEVNGQSYALKDSNTIANSEEPIPGLPNYEAKMSFHRLLDSIRCLAPPFTPGAYYFILPSLLQEDSIDLEEFVSIESSFFFEKKEEIRNSGKAYVLSIIHNSSYGGGVTEDFIVAIDSDSMKLFYSSSIRSDRFINKKNEGELVFVASNELVNSFTIFPYSDFDYQVPQKTNVLIFSILQSGKLQQRLEVFWPLGRLLPEIPIYEEQIESIVDLFRTSDFYSKFLFDSVR